MKFKKHVNLFLPPLLVDCFHALIRLLTKPIVKQALAKHGRIHLGCGPNLIPGWANVDLEGGKGIVRWDLRYALPVSTGCIDYIFTEHFIEHLDREIGARLLQECYRVLKPGGVLRVSTPDLDMLVDLYRRGDIKEWEDLGWMPNTPCQMINEGMRLWGHQFVYDKAEFEQMLRGVGFNNLVYVEKGESSHMSLRSLESRPFHRDIILEAAK